MYAYLDVMDQGLKTDNALTLSLADFYNRNNSPKLSLSLDLSLDDYDSPSHGRRLIAERQSGTHHVCEQKTSQCKKYLHPQIARLPTSSSKSPKYN